MPARQGLEVPGGVGEGQRRANQCDGHVGHQVETGLCLRRRDERKERVVVSLEGERTVESDLGKPADRDVLLADRSDEVGIDRQAHQRSVVLRRALPFGRLKGC